MLQQSINCKPDKNGGKHMYSIELLRLVHLVAMRIDDLLNALLEANGLAVDALVLHHAHEV